MALLAQMAHCRGVLGLTSKIPVTVVSGFLGSGKTTLLNRLLAQPMLDAARESERIVVIVNELGDIGLDHSRSLRVRDSIVLIGSGCICCTVRGELVGALRELFMAALHKRMAPFSRVIVETTGIADPSPIIYTLRHDVFLRERYVYDGCTTVVDSLNGRQQLETIVEAVQQAVLADVLVFSKTDLAAPESVGALQATLHGVNPDAAQYRSDALPSLVELVRVCGQATNTGATIHRSHFWSSGNMGAGRSNHLGVEVLSLQWARALSRAEFARAMEALHADSSLQILRIKGALWFGADAHASLVNGVHQQLYPVEALTPLANAFVPGVETSDTPPDERISTMVFIFRGVSPDVLLQKLATLMPQAQAFVSLQRNLHG